ncbi:MAG: carbohydrate-binding domain-containing protein [Atopobiaceae bacterium]|nr:carbohydrate-binding domain-containing protein [Atopobiaceae bacterium]
MSSNINSINRDTSLLETKALILLASVILSLFMLVGCSQTTTHVEASDSSSLATTTASDTSTSSSTTEPSQTQTQNTSTQVHTEIIEAGAAAEVTLGDLGAQVSPLDTTAMFTERDLDASYDEASATIVEFSSTGAQVSGNGASAQGSVVTISEEGSYIIRGSASEAQIIVDTTNTSKVQLILDNVNLSSSSTAPIYVKQADKVFVTIPEGTSSTVATTGTFVAIDENNIDAPIFSKDDLTINGKGSLSVSSTAGHGIVSKDDLVLAGVTLNVEATDHALAANDSIRFASGTYQLSGGTDAVHTSGVDEGKGYIYVADGSITLQAASDGFDASGTMQVDGGSITVAAGDDGLHAEKDMIIADGTIDVSQSVEGLEGARILVSGGDTHIVSSDDGVNACGDDLTNSSGDETAEQIEQIQQQFQEYGGMPGAPMDPNQGGMQGGMGGRMGGMGGMDEYDSTASLTITGGRIEMRVEGDGLDSNGDFQMTGGEAYVSGPTMGGNGSLDYAGEGQVTGGILVAAGTADMAMGFGTTSTQGNALIALNSQEQGTITLSDAAGNVLASYEPQVSYSCVVISAPGLSEGASYELQTGSTIYDLQMTSTTMGGGSFGGMGIGGMGGMGAFGDMGHGPMGPMGGGNQGGW